MSATVEELVQQAKALPHAELELLLERLLESVNETTGDELHPSWDAEIERRLATYDRGEVQAIDADEVFAKAAKIAK